MYIHTHIYTYICVHMYKYTYTYTCTQDDFAAAHMTTMRRAQDLIMREQTKAQERLEDAALELERVRTELIHSTSKTSTPSESGTRARKHMAFF